MKFNKPTDVVAHCQIRHALCPHPPSPVQSETNSQTDLMLNATLRTLQVTVRRPSNSDQHTIRKMDERSTGKHFFIGFQFLS
jgi:hypothetical protein